MRLSSKKDLLSQCYSVIFTPVACAGEHQAHGRKTFCRPAYPLGSGSRRLSVFAPADIVTVTFTGIVGDSAYDPNGTFGCTGDACAVGAYKGDAYTAVFTYNTNIGVLYDNPGVNVYLYGGSSQPLQPPSPLIGDATVTVNGVTYELSGAYYAGLENNSNTLATPLPNTLTAQVTDANGDQIFAQVATTTDPPQFPVSITTPFSGDFGSAANSFIEFDCSGGSCAGYINGDMTVSPQESPHFSEG